MKPTMAKGKDANGPQKANCVEKRQEVKTKLMPPPEGVGLS